MKGKKAFRKHFLNVATWNIRTLVESTGDARICRSRPVVCQQLVNRKLDILMMELKRYNIAVAGIQETKWFGADVWPAIEGYTFLHSGRPLPKNDRNGIRNEGVGIALDKKATEAWKAAGEVWEAVSSRIISARLKVIRNGQRKPGGSRQTSNTYMTIVSVYAPTAKAPPGVKLNFFQNLQDLLDRIAPSDILVLLGDFNARVGSRGLDNDMWSDVVGKHGIDDKNEAGDHLLDFCATNELSVMNTWFEKKQIYLGTWMHPATKQFHMIDLVVMRAAQRMLCTDVRVMRGANCWTDHQLVRAKVRLSVKHVGTAHNKDSPFAVHILSDKVKEKAFCEEVSHLLQQQPHDPECPAEETWNTIKTCLIQASESTIGKKRKKQPDWFLENADRLAPLIATKNSAHQKFLKDSSFANKKEFRRCQRVVKAAVDAAKDEWVYNTAKEAEAAVKDSRVRWGCIQKLRMCYAGRRPLKTNSVLKNDGTLSNGLEELQACWRNHFMKILNVPSEYRDEVIDGMVQQPVRWEFDGPPTDDELIAALQKLRRRKAGGSSGILPEMILSGGAELWDRLLQLMEKIWEEQTVVQDWKDAVVVPIPKKGNLNHCDNWRGISLLDVVGKLFGRILQERLQVLAESLLPESQCGFRKGRGCTDMIYVARQLLEKTREHDDKLYVLFVDLKKAYDSVPRPALWKVLDKCGVPPVMLKIIKSLHEGMQAAVRVNTEITRSFEVRNGLRQGCTLAPVLFNVYFAAMMNNWRAQCPDVGVGIKFKCGRKLVGDRTAKSRLNEVKVTESQFADDAAVYTTERDALRRSTGTLVDVANDWGLTVSMEKTKAMAIGRFADTSPLQLENGSIEMVDDFRYLGSVISNSCEVQKEVECRIAKAARAFGCLKKSIFQNKSLSLNTKKIVYRAVVLSSLLYSAETWVTKANNLKRLNCFHNKCVRTILGVTRYVQWKQRISTRHLAIQFEMEETVSEMIMAQRLRWLGHLGRMEEVRLPKQLLFGELVKKRPSHGTKKRWRDIVFADLKAMGISDIWYERCQDRQWWKMECKKGIEATIVQRCQNTCSANRSTNLIFPCHCGRSFRRRGDLTRHQRFCPSEDN